MTSAAAAKLKDLPAEVKKERTARLIAAGKRAEQTYIHRFLGRRLVALFEGDGGYTENYIRVYAETENEGGMYEVKLLKGYHDGAYAEVIKEIK